MVASNGAKQCYCTSAIGHGWDGRVTGQLQNASAFVWMAKAVDYKGHIIQRKGNAVLIK